MSDWLQHQVLQMRVNTRDEWLWDSTLVSFKRQYANNLKQEKARMTLRQGIRMQEKDIDGYIATFEELVRHAQYDINSPQTIDMFTRGLPTSLYKTIYQHDQPETFEEWRRATIKRQGIWFHMNARKALDKFKSFPQKSSGARPFFAPARHPEAMDVDRTRARLALMDPSPEEMQKGVKNQWRKDQ